MGTYDQIASVDESPDALAEDRALELFVEVGGGHVPAEDQVEGARGHLLGEVLPAKLDPFPEVILNLEAIPRADEGTITQVRRQVLQAARRVAPLAGAPDVGPTTLK
jgi:hypothetical protein